jgi:hypothetical protein
MQQTLRFNALMVLSGLLFISHSYGQAPYTSALEGQYQGHFNIGKCDVSSITAKVRMSTSVGEPTVYLNVKWHNGSGSASNCLANERFTPFIKIYSNYASRYFYILADGAIGIIPDGNGSWGSDPLAASPGWGQLFVKDPPYRTTSNSFDFVPADYAKTLWKSGFSISAVVLMNGSGRLYSIQ